MENIKARAKRLMDCFNLSIEGWEKIDAYQGSLCYVCRTKPVSGKRLATDHCHTTGLVRGLLCNHCNHLLGKIENALKRHPAKPERPEDQVQWISVILERIIQFLIYPPATKALGEETYGYAGRVGTKQHRKDVRRAAKLRDKS